MKLPLLVLGDVHNRWAQAEAIIQALQGRYRRVIFLGDYFDRFNDGPRQAAETAAWLAASLAKPERIHLLGNHDLPYFFPDNDNLLCPGFTWEKHRAAEEFLNRAPRERLRLAHLEDGWLFSHAGFAPYFVDGISPDAAVAEANALLPRLHEGQYESLLAQGRGRGGRALVGGVVWLDWWSEFTPIPGFCQIVGHSFGDTAKAQWIVKRPRISTHLTDVKPGIYEKPASSSVNWCLDCELCQVALVHEDRLEIVDTKEFGYGS